MKKIGKRIKSFFRNAGTGMTTFYLLAAAAPAFGQTAAGNLVPGELKTVADQVLEALTGDLAKVIIACAFAGSCIAYAVNKDNEQAKQKALAVIIAAAALGLSLEIVDLVMKAGKGGK
jgi:type IV secretory pathway VirB2 component (pilin)